MFRVFEQVLRGYVVVWRCERYGGQNQNTHNLQHLWNLKCKPTQRVEVITWGRSRALFLKVFVANRTMLRCRLIRWIMGMWLSVKTNRWYGWSGSGQLTAADRWIEQLFIVWFQRLVCYSNGIGYTAFLYRILRVLWIVWHEWSWAYVKGSENRTVQGYSERGRIRRIILAFSMPFYYWL